MISMKATQCKLVCLLDYRPVPIIPVTWIFSTLDERKVCEYSDLSLGYTINLSDRNIDIYPGIKLMLKCVVVGADDSTCDVFVEYHPDSDITAYFKVIQDGLDTEVVYMGHS